MHLKIYGKPSTVPSNNCLIKIEYHAARELTIVTVDSDLVTLGTAVEVLTQQYNAALEAFAPTAQEHIRNTIKEAVYNAEC